MSQIYDERFFEELKFKDKTLKIYNHLKDELTEDHSNKYGNYWIEFKKASKKLLLDTVNGITKEDIVKEIKPVKNAIIFIKDNVLYCKHYDTIIFAFDFEELDVIELYANCSQTTNRQLDEIAHWLREQGLIDIEKWSEWSWIRENHTKHEPTTRGMKNKFWDSEYGGGF